MQTLYNLVTYNHERYEALTEESQRRAIERLVTKLRYLEGEILHVPDGSINISGTGTVFIRNYPLRLQQKINGL